MTSRRLTRTTDETDAVLSCLDATAFPADAVMLKTSRHGTVWRVPGDASVGELVVKCERIRTSDHRVKARIGQSRLHRHWRGARWLTRRGFDTPECFVLFEGCAAGDRIETLVMRFREGGSLLDHLLGDAEGGIDAGTCAEALGLHVRAMIDIGRFNRDNKPSNLLITPHGTLVVLDCVAIRRCRPGSRAAMARMLASLAIEPTGVACTPRAALAWRAVRAATSSIDDAKRVWAMARQIHERHHPTMRAHRVSAATSAVGTKRASTGV